MTECINQDPDMQNSVDSQKLLSFIEDNQLCNLVTAMAAIQNGIASKGMDCIYDKNVFVRKCVNEARAVGD